jgi:hypothetical protein
MMNSVEDEQKVSAADGTSEAHEQLAQDLEKVGSA